VAGEWERQFFACSRVSAWIKFKILLARKHVTQKGADKVDHKEDKPLPGCKAILLCERTLTELGTGRISLIGLIGTLSMPAFPTRTKPMKLFLHLVDGIGDYDITVEVHDLAEDRVVLKTRVVRISFADRLMPRKLIFSVPGLPITHAGRYDVIVFGNGKEIDRQQIRATATASGETK
jgi:hypothetical protein